MFKKLTENTGEAIKSLAKILYYLQMALVVIAVIIGVIMSLYGLAYDDEVLIVGISVIGGAIGVAIEAIISAMFLYGLGELISTNIEIAKNTRTDAPALEQYTPAPQQTAPAPTPDMKTALETREPTKNEIKCPNCGNIQSATITRCLSCSNVISEKTFCPNCGKEIYVTQQDKEWGDIQCPSCEYIIDLKP